MLFESIIKQQQSVAYLFFSTLSKKQSKSEINIYDLSGDQTCEKVKMVTLLGTTKWIMYVCCGCRFDLPKA